jgi:hypothetical protein
MTYICRDCGALFGRRRRRRKLFAVPAFFLFPLLPSNQRRAIAAANLVIAIIIALNLYLQRFIQKNKNLILIRNFI